MARGRFYAVSAAVLFSILIIFNSHLYAAAPSISGLPQMQVGGAQTLTASGGCGVPDAYQWAIVRGVGSISGTGSGSVTYSAPGSNPYCRSNATVRVTDACGSGEINIAVTGMGSGNLAAKHVCVKDTSSPKDPNGIFCPECQVVNPNPPYNCLIFNCASHDDWIWCDGSQSTFYTVAQSTVSCDACFVNMWQGTVCQDDSSERTIDVRSEYLKSAGCCPAQLYAGSECNGTGNSCTNLPSRSSANMRSGNLFHSQDVGKLTLSYNSIDASDGPVGKKWTHNYSRKLTALSDNQTLTLLLEDGNVFYYRLSGGVFYPEAITGDTSQIVKNGNGTYTQTTKTGTIYQYDTTGKLTSIADRNGRTTTLAYSGTDLASITDFNGRTTTITNTAGKITGITDPMGRTHTIGYTSGYITSISDPLNNAWQFSYDAQGYMLIKSDPLNRNVNYTYDTSGRVLNATGPDGKVKAMTYNQAGTTTHTEEDGGVWTYRYDPTFTVKTEVTDPKGYTVKYAYDNRRNLIKKTEHDGSYTSHTYDANGNRLTTTDPLGKTTTYAYNALNLVSGVTDPKGNATLYGYDGNGNLTSITAPGNAVTQYTYDTKGNILSVTTPNNKTTTMTYDSKNNLITVTDPKNGTVTMTYDSNGNMLTQTDALNTTTTFEYNSLNQLTKITDPKGYITQYTYDYNGNRLSSTDPNSTTTNYLYNYKDQLTKITDALNNATNLEYGGAGCPSCGGGGDKLTSLTDAKANTTIFEYDQTGKLTKETDPLGKITTYGYDGKGNLTSRTSPDSKTITYSYDLNNRLTEKVYSDGSATAFRYDDNGNITYAGNRNIAYNFTYDASNRITQITDSNARTIRYSYDGNGNRISMTVPGSGFPTPSPDSGQITYGYDDNNLLSRITTSLGNFTFTYDAGNRRLTRTMPNGTTSTYGYDENSRLTGIIARKGTAMIDSAAYTHDYAGNRITRTTPRESWSYGYDSIYRLTQAAPSGGLNRAESYTYDQVGNRLTKTNELPPQDDETANYTYDDENRLTGVTIARDAKLRELAFTYDPFGRRITKTIIRDQIGSYCMAPNVCPRTKTYVYDNLNIILEYNADNAVTARYTHGPAIDEPLAVEQKTATGYTPYFYHADGLGSITALSDRRGNVVRRYTYDSFGNEAVTADSSFSQPYTFTAREYDAETGMYFYRARYYDPKVGRFVTKDPIGFSGGDVNLFSYVWNSPLNWIDPRGLAGDGQKAWQEYVDNPANAIFGGFDPKPSRGHSDFAGSDKFDWTKEDRGWTAPESPTGISRHFRPYYRSVGDILDAINQCNKNKFERAMHRIQDAPFHYDKKYRAWRLGHALDSLLGKDPDSDDSAFYKSNERTKYYLKMWNEKCLCK